MLNADTELLFPIRVIPELQNLRGPVWHQFVGEILQCDDDSIEKSAFVYMIVKMGGCVTCNSDSFRATRGCTQCSRQTVRRYKGSDQELLELFNQCKGEITEFLAERQKSVHRDAR